MKEKKPVIKKQAFKELTDETIFIAASYDVQNLRIDIENEIKNEVTRLTKNSSKLTPFSWDISLKGEPFDQAMSMQKNLPRPADKLCKGLVCIIGERIGFPLEDDFKIDIIKDIHEWTDSTKDFKLKHPWPTTIADQKKALAQGYFPLTGTVFEFIDAYTSGAYKNDFATGEYKKELKLFILSEEAITPENKESITLNKRNFYHWKSEQIRDQKEWDDWQKNEYRIQTDAVRNFICALSQKGIAQLQNFSRERILLEVGKMVGNIIGPVADANPYRYLKYFNVSDSLYGRTNEIEIGKNKLRSRFESPYEPNLLEIHGQSGSGKSSFLRAGIIKEFTVNSQHRDQYKALVFRPTDFNYIDGIPINIFQRVLEMARIQVDDDLGKQLELSKLVDNPEAPKFVLKILEDYLKNAGPGMPYRLLIGIDQFEEIVDYLTNPTLANKWKPFITFIRLASSSKHIGIIYTIEKSRRDILKETLEKQGMQNVFENAQDVFMHVSDDNFLGEIIEQPFAKAGLTLSDSVVKKLKENIQASLKTEEGSKIENSILPLVALKLSKLFDSLSAKYDSIKDISFAGTFKESSSNKDFRIGLENIELELDFESVIHEEIQLAWREAYNDITMDNESIDNFLQHLISVGGKDSLQIQLKTINPSSFIFLEEQKLIKAFEAHRLLIPSKKNEMRLVHETVIRNWPEALKWFENKKNKLKAEAFFRNDILQNRDPGILISPDKKTISSAALVLQSYSRVWRFTSSSNENLSPDDKLFMDRCLAIFSKNETPYERADADDEECEPFIFIAATYGLTDLIDRYYSADNNCLQFRFNKNGRTILHSAAWAKEETTRYLIEKGLDANLTDDKGWKPIAMPISQGRRDITIFKILLPGTNTTEAIGPGNTGLAVFCAGYGNIEMIKLLENESLDLMTISKDENGLSALHYASAIGNLAVFRYLLDKCDKFQVDNQGFTVLHHAAFEGHFDIIQEIILAPDSNKLIAAVDHNNMTALHIASENKKKNCVELLLKFIDPNLLCKDLYGVQKTALHLLLEKTKSKPGDIDLILQLVQLFLTHEDLDPNIKDSNGHTILELAADNVQIQKTLLKNVRIDPLLRASADGKTAISIAAKLEEWEIFNSYILKSDIKLESIVDEEGNTLLHILAIHKMPKDILLKYLPSFTNENIGMLNKARKSCLMCALNSNNWILVNYFLDINGKQLIRSISKNQPILIECLEGGADNKILGKLISNNPALIMEKDHSGWNILHRAYAAGLLQFVDWFMANRRISKKQKEILFQQKDLVGRKPAQIANHFENIKTKIEQHESAISYGSWDSNICWQKVSDIEHFKNNINYIDSIHLSKPDTAVHSCELSFYDAALVQLIRFSWQNKYQKIYFLKCKDKYYPLDGNSYSIHDVNDQQVLSINQNTILDYVKFFCFFVRGKDGPFIIAEKYDQKEIPPFLPEWQKNELKKMLRPAIYNGYKEKTNEYIAFANVYYSDEVYKAIFYVSGKGLIEMKTDNVIISKLKEKIYMPINRNEVKDRH